MAWALVAVAALLASAAVGCHFKCLDTFGNDDMGPFYRWFAGLVACGYGSLSALMFSMVV